MWGGGGCARERGREWDNTSGGRTGKGVTRGVGYIDPASKGGFETRRREGSIFCPLSGQVGKREQNESMRGMKRIRHRRSGLPSPRSRRQLWRRLGGSRATSAGPARSVGGN